MITVTLSGRLPSGLSSFVVTRAVRSVVLATRPSLKGSVGVRFVTEAVMAKLNHSYRGKNRPTDVLSFTAEAPEKFRIPTGVAKELGDIIIAPAYARREAARRGISATEELVRLIVHGTLHLLGYDHATDAQESRMFRLQEKLVEKVATRL